MDFAALNDAELVYLARGGAVKAVEVLQKKYESCLRVWIREAAKARDTYETAADDFYAAALIGFYKAVETFRDEKGFFYSYLETIVKREVTAVLRRVILDKETNFALSLDRPIRGSSGDSFLVLKEAENETKKEDYRLRAEKVARFVERSPEFSDIDRRLFSLRFAGYSYREIAEKLAISVKTVDNRYQRIKKILRDKRDFFSGEFID